MTYHIPVLLNTTIEYLVHDPNGIYIDLTFGGGGHSKAILQKLDKGKLYAFDQDEEAIQNANQIHDERLTFIQANFEYFQRHLRLYKETRIHGILADLGVSSHHFDTPERGFSTRFDAPLDMRMNQKQTLTAQEVLNTFEQKELQILFSKYGEIKNAKTLAMEIGQERVKQPIVTTQQLTELIKPLAPRKKYNQYAAQVFQALRIVVNNELEVLKKMLQQSIDLLVPHGRIAIISYHSLEDRLVKNFFNKGNFEGVIEKDFYGNILRPLVPVNRKPIIPSTEEINTNTRARSAKLRIAEKL